MPSPNVGTGDNVLMSVSATSPDNVWVVGHHGSKPLIEHYDGATWSVETLPDVGYGALDGVAAGSDTEADAVGFTTTSRTTQTLGLHSGRSAVALRARECYT